MQQVKRTNKSLTTLAYEELKRAILNGELSQETPLSEVELAENLNVSRTVIQRALYSLEKDNLIVKNPKNNRRYVKEIDKKETIDLWEIRIVLEKLAIEKVCQYRKKEDIKKLYSFFKEYENNNFTKENMDKYVLEDAKFHEELAKISGNKQLLNMINNFHIQISTFNVGTIRPHEETLKEHLFLIEAIEEKNIEKAKELMEKHLEKSMRIMIQDIFDK